MSSWDSDNDDPPRFLSYREEDSIISKISDGDLPGFIKKYTFRLTEDDFISLDEYEIYDEQTFFEDKHSFYFGVACELGEIEIAKWIYEKYSACIDLQYCFSHKNMTCLSYALDEGNVQIVSWLLTLDEIDVNVICKDKLSALACALWDDFPVEVIEKMIQLGAKGCETDANSIISLAIQKNHYSIVLQLLLAGESGCYDDGSPMYAECEKLASLLRNWNTIQYIFTLKALGIELDANMIEMLTEFCDYSDDNDE